MVHSKSQSKVWSGHRRVHIRLAFCLAMMASDRMTALADDHPDYGRLLEQSEVLPALEMLAERTKAGWESIRYWEGRCEIQSAAYFRSPSLASDAKQRLYLTQEQPSAELIERLDKIHKSTIGHWFLKDLTATFTVDNVGGLYHIFMETEKADIFDETDRFLYRRPATEEPIHFLTTPERSYQFETKRKYGPRKDFPLTNDRPYARTIFADKPDALNTLTFVDVREYFSYDKLLRNGKPPYTAASHLLSLSNGIRNDQVGRLTKRVKVYLTAASPPVYTLVFGNDENFDVARFDGNYGFNLSLYATFGPKNSDTSRKISFREIDRVFVPDRLVQTVNSTKHENGGAWELIWTIKTTSINQPVPAFAFDVKKYGLRYGDRMYDKVAGEITVFNENAEFVPLHKFAFDPMLLQDAEKSQ